MELRERFTPRNRANSLRSASVSRTGRNPNPKTRAAAEGRRANQEQSYLTPDETEQGEDEHNDQDDPQNAHVCLPCLAAPLKRGEARFGYGQISSLPGSRR
jgi:hypothetical protein